MPSNNVKETNEQRHAVTAGRGPGNQMIVVRTSIQRDDDRSNNAQQRNEREMKENVQRDVRMNELRDGWRVLMCLSNVRNAVEDRSRAGEGSTESGAISNNLILNIECIRGASFDGAGAARGDGSMRALTLIDGNGVLLRMRNRRRAETFREQHFIGIKKIEKKFQRCKRVGSTV